jgi:hypothetical protein
MNSKKQTNMTTGKTPPVKKKEMVSKKGQELAKKKVK